jgi:hypothetical protein
MPSKSTPEQRKIWSDNKKRRTHENNMERMNDKLESLDINAEEIEDIDEIIALLKKLKRLRVREAVLVEQGIMPAISDYEIRKFTSWLGQFSTFLEEYEAMGKPTDEAVRGMLTICAKFHVPNVFINAHPERGCWQKSNRKKKDRPVREGSSFLPRETGLSACQEALSFFWGQASSPPK